MSMNRRLRDYLPHTFHSWLYDRKIDFLFLRRRVNNWRLVLKLRLTSRKRTIRVCFLINEVAKWKSQSLYDALKADGSFEPIILLTAADRDFQLNKDDRKEKIKNSKRYFLSYGLNVELAYDFEKDECISPMRYRPDILFYQQPWYISEEQHPRNLSWNVLTCYIPYYVPNYGSISVECQDGFHIYLWRYYLLNEKWAAIFRKCKGLVRCLPKFVPAGHTMLDVYAERKLGKLSESNLVIYAPHWSFNHPGNENFENFSTFLKSGRIILDYAKKHPEIKWAFKPHPTLKHALRRSGAMTESEIKDYYDAWGKIGEVCESGDYMKLFFDSYVLITDCASFLVEYVCTGNPIIHLVSSDRKLEPMEPSRQLFSTYYQAHNCDEMMSFFNLILEQRKDPRRDERISAVKDAGLIGNNASEKIIADFKKVFGVR